MEVNELLSQLNPGQQVAVQYNDGPSLVIAGAGSGKTRVLTYKIAYLIQMGLKPWNMLALTFTNKAAAEMKKRIGQLVGDDNARHIYMGTFHSIFSRILRQEAELLGYTSDFTIYDDADSRSLVKTIVKERDLDDKIYKPSVVHNRISMAKNHLVSAIDYFNDRGLMERDSMQKMPEVGKIYIEYNERCRKSNAMDFDDLLMMTYQLFEQHEDIRRKWADKFRFVLVDEYQDTNKVQQKIVEQLTRENQRVCVVGDDAQSIYAFRGANIDNILDFNKIYPDSKLFKLEQNYRSTQRIVQAANSLIKRNERQIPKNVFSENEEGDCLVLKEAVSDKEEAAIVCKEIKAIMHREGLTYSDFAILYRTNAQSRSFEDECLKTGIPYRIYGGLSFYQRKEIKDIIAYFRLVANHNDEEAFKRIVNYPTRGLGDTTVAKIAQAANRFRVSYWDVAFEPERFQLAINGGIATKLRKFTSLILSFSDKLADEDAYTLGQEIINHSGISEELYSSHEPEYITRQENLEEFMASIQDFVEEKREMGRMQDATLPEFLQDISLKTDKESEDGNSSKISMMTVHSAKGLEFPTVFVVGMEENIFPSAMAMQSMRELEEERRLLYVAITRAEKHCILTYARSRWRYGTLETGSPSRFLRDIDSSYIKTGTSISSNTERRSRSGFGFRNEYGHGADRLSGMSSRMQNSRPVGEQFMADPQPKITRGRQQEAPVDPLSPAFRREMDVARSNSRLGHGAQAGGFRQATELSGRPTVPAGFKRVTHVSTSSQPSAPQSDGSQLMEGSVISHQRFGVGTVIKLEGEGDNRKATVEFNNTGTKQLLLRFAKFTIVK